MKQLFAGFVAIVFSLILTTNVVIANEGTVELSGSDVSCEGVSLWKGNSYRVVGRCEGLVYPYATQLEHYVLWAKTTGKGELVRVGEVERGYWDGNVSESYTDLYMTAESNGLPRRPSDNSVVSGMVREFGFSASESVSAPVATPAPIASENTGEMTVQKGAEAVSASTGAVGSVIGKIVRSLLVIIAVVVVLVIGTSLVFRRRGSVST